MTEREEKTASEKRVPVLLNTALTIGKLLMIGSTTAVAALSLLARADMIWVAVRAAATLLVTGLLTWAVCWIVSYGSLSAARSQLQEAQPVEAAPALLNKRA
jgi:hypothetical protein